ncbi:MAG: lamin tail domain-containing protein, partial [Phycisphaerales bacterium]|nr:lamin tail domain-containing protein [Phycisphaerales bacterium]
MINEINADPSNANDYLDGDANGDGVGSFSDDEFLEFVNYSGSAIDLGNWTVSDGAGLRHVFPIGTVIDDQCA